jgi:hypothetical protein
LTETNFYRKCAPIVHFVGWVVGWLKQENLLKEIFLVKIAITYFSFRNILCLILAWFRIRFNILLRLRFGLRFSRILRIHFFTLSRFRDQPDNFLFLKRKHCKLKISLKKNFFSPRY